MVQVQDTVVGKGPAVPAAGTAGCGEGRGPGRQDGRAGVDGGAGGRSEDGSAVDGSVVAWAASVPTRGGRSQRGMVSAEWAVGIVAAVAIAGVLLAVVTSGAVKAALLGIVLKVLSTFLKFAH
ncbi:hypothetical protein GCM10022197_34940 [Microlunatus spumicola]|uniref:DUF4244 domain-containing protein n=1 Tax=Microlunatus spumicola TaxID=81499 RepID=A0ABP6XZ42_9ACTN